MSIPVDFGCFDCGGLWFARFVLLLFDAYGLHAYVFVCY